MLADVTTLHKEFDYLVAARAEVAVGSVVRVDLGGRRVGGWITAVDVEPPAGVKLRPVAKVSGYGPPADVVDLARWIAWRYAGTVNNVLTSASPPRNVSVLPPPLQVPTTVPAAIDSTADEAFARGQVVIRTPPAADERELVLAAVRAAAAKGRYTLIVTPSVDRARELWLVLRRAGVAAALYPRDWGQAYAGATVIGTRVAALAPMASIGAVLLLDEHDEALQEERQPTWHCRVVLAERARRASAPFVMASPIPTLEALASGELMTPSRSDERRGWPVTDVVDMRKEDPAAGRFAARLVPVLRGPGPVLCVLNRTGRSKLLACGACGELVRCERHQVPLSLTDERRLVCSFGDEDRPVVCAHCGSTQLKNLRVGVTRAREELESLAGRPVVEVTAAHELKQHADVYVGTESLLHQVRQAHAVIFLDFDHELLAPRQRAGEHAYALLARAAGILGGRDGGGRLVVQTRQPRHPVLEAVRLAEPGRFVRVESERRQALGQPPFAAQALISQSAAAEFVERLGRPRGVVVRGPLNGQWLVSAPTHQQLCDTLAAVERPTGRLRIEVDPLRA